MERYPVRLPHRWEQSPLRVIPLLGWAGGFFCGQTRSPAQSGLKFQVRFGSSRETLSRAPWLGPQGVESFFTVPGVVQSQGGRWIQYKATLVSPNGANSPVLKSVTIE